MLVPFTIGRSVNIAETHETTELQRHPLLKVTSLSDAGSFRQRSLRLLRVNRNSYRFTRALRDTARRKMNLMKAEKEICIQNVVASASLSESLDLDAIVIAFPDTEWRPEVFPGLAFRLKKPKTCTLLFHSGRMVCTGAKSEREARRAIMKVARELKKAGIIITGKPEIKIVNVVASGSLGAPVDLEELSERVRGSLMYEPEMFPAAIYRMESPKVVFLIFSTGKIVCVGAKREEEVYAGVENLRRGLEELDVL